MSLQRTLLHSFEIANYKWWPDSNEVIEEHLYEWNLDGYFYPIAHFLGMDGVAQLPDHANELHWGENHKEGLVSFGVIGGVLYVLCQLLRHLPQLLHHLSTILQYYKHRRRRRLDEHQNRLDEYYTTLVSSREQYGGGGEYNEEMLRVLMQEDLPHLTTSLYHY